MMPELGVVLAMREDHLAGLDPYAPLLIRRLRTRFRIERLGPDEALEAVTKPALNAGCPFDAGVAERLVDDLRQIKVQSPERAGEMVVFGPYVEPVQLQVVCNRLWEALPEQADRAIQWEEIEQYGNIDRALTDFYESALNLAKVSEPSQGLALSERRLRRWFSEQLITPMRTRGLALQGKDETAGLPNVAVDVLEKRHLIRADARAGARWYELVHDRLVDPILKSNQAWEAARQTPLRMTAKHWQETKSEALLYRDKALKEALAWAKAYPDEVEPYETEFLQLSQRIEQVRARTRQITTAVAIGLAIGLCIMVVLAIAAFRGQQVAQQAQATAVAESDIRATAQAQAEARRLEAEAAQATAVAETKVRATAEAQAVEQRQIAVARQLAAQASRYATEKQTDLALLLNLEANRVAGATWAQGSLLEAVQSNRDLITFLRDHSDEVRSVAFSPDGKVLASAGKDTTIILWDVSTALNTGVATRRPMGQPLKGHTLDVNSVAFSPDGKMFASASNDATIILWDVATRQPIGEPLTGHSSAVNSVAFSPAPPGGGTGGKLLASGSDDNTIILWDVETQQPVGQPLEGHSDSVTSVAFSPDGKLLASASRDATVRLWNVATGQPRGQPLTGHEQMVYCVAFSPDGKLLASGSADGTVRLWDVATGRPHGPDEGRLTEHKGIIWSLAFSPDGKVLASGSDDKTIVLWNVASGQTLWPAARRPQGLGGWLGL